MWNAVLSESERAALAHFMQDGTAIDPALGRQHIIKRPRLTRLLDEAKARVILLVAPAGYGKTILAREWLDQGERRAAWYAGSPASADVAAVAAGVARAVDEIVPGAARRMRERLRVTDAPESEVDVLSDLLAEDLVDWPDDAWLAIDDYHFAMASAASEAFVERLSERAPIRILAASRVRPTWASARRLLYGDVHELSRASLAMTHDEASAVLSLRAESEVPGLLAIADGWPAVIGLAALTGDLAVPDTLPPALYDFFAEELFQSASPSLREKLKALSLSPSDTSELLQELFGPEDAAWVAGEAIYLGFLTRSPAGMLEMHPLLRNFLQRKLTESSSAATQELARRVGAFLIDRSYWDEAFALVERFSLLEMLPTLLEAALPTALSEGRLSSLGRWITHGRRFRITSPILDLAESEVAFRQGSYAQAEALGLQALRQLGSDHQFSSRACFRAAESAYFMEQFSAAVELHKKAESIARAPSDVRAAVWGQLHSSSHLGEKPEGLYERLVAASGSTVDDTLRLAQARLIIASDQGPLDEALAASRHAFHLVAQAGDPMIRSGFIHTFAYTLSLAACYGEALDIAQSGLKDVEDHRLAFAEPDYLTLMARVQLGLRHFDQAHALLDQAEEISRSFRSVFHSMNIAVVRTRLHIARGRYLDALGSARRVWSSLPAESLYAELQATRGLALACAGMHEEAIATCETVEKMLRHVETRALVPYVRAIVAMASADDSASRQVLEAFTRSLEIGELDSFVTAYRGDPRLLITLGQHDNCRDKLLRVLGNARDDRLAVTAGLKPPDRSTAPLSILSPREREVLTLLGRGMSNRDIGKMLFISEATVKAHVRRVFEKLGVRTRTEAALLAASAYAD